ncbi:TetR/AcrR family transcriptional regulator [Parasulfuritortus cantonensis]|uniref:TetR/AcrR family transcriptional regulator n=1 Tax=Parasulfuritortus cantonensis TaxID=2528202 RepID=A0A4V2NV13_9PROT|nr:TetR/AcrR family transcriptional regulator [Parasulfuritortus cantonensis]TCJ11676.1 TetR/AcrR family transcriptional regulator [Parasulfuritortus cantonensis]
MSLANPRKATRDEILRVSMPMFAQRGYDGVTMREIAAAVGIQAAALYYHFPDKQSLYMAVMEHAFSDRLKRFLASVVEDLTRDPELLLLLQRERIDGDAARRKLLVEQLFAPPMQALTRLLRDLAPDRDANLLALSLTGMAMFHLETQVMARFLPGWKPEHAEPEHIARHLDELLETMFGAES